MGISTAYLVGSNVFLGDQEKKRSVPGGSAEEALASNDPVPTGQLASNRDAAQTGWTDLFKGEGIESFAYLDLAKVQLFFLIDVVLLYAAAVGMRFAGQSTGPDGFRFPEVGVAMLALLGISHAGYLAIKAAKQPRSIYGRRATAGMAARISRTAPT
jgi:hypothetical protein